MKRLSRIILLGLIAASAAGCASPAENGQVNLSDSRSNFPIKVEPQVATLTVQVDRDGQGIMRGDDDRIIAFAEQWKARGHGLLSIAAPGGTANQSAAKSAVNDVHRILAANGVNKSSVRMSVYRGAANDVGAPITLSFITDVASAADCGKDWSENIGFSPRNLPWPEFGCSTQHNFAASLDDPRDLVAPRASDSADASRRATVLQKYRQGVSTQTTATEADSGKVSNIAP